MSLAPGTRLGPYEIVSPLGAGGMGEVYKARDTRLGRDVAIKVLPSHLSENPEFKQRFEREAKAISQLSHPHICALYDVGSHEGTEYLVMELLEGQNLSDRLEKGPLPTEQVLKFGIEIADALDKAHRQGIVHRDLKPGNIMLTRSGVKLLDFGLAKTLVPGPSTRGQAYAPGGWPEGPGEGVSSLPTELSPSQPLTERGMIQGTFQYMAPEQLEGKGADRRTDIFAFGCVLYEMATGKKAFTGSSRASLIGAIMNAEPPSISSLQPMTPPALDRVVKTCLAKDPDDRFQDAHDVKLQLEWIAEAGSQAGAPAVVISRRRNRDRIAWIGFGAATLVALLLGIGYVRRAPVPPSPVKLPLVLPEAVGVVQTPQISPDGKTLAFVAIKNGKSQIWIRPLEGLDPRPVSGTDGASGRPIWSPDSRDIAFVAYEDLNTTRNGKLERVKIAGAPPQTICDIAGRAAHGAWGRAGTILFDAQGMIRRVSAAGGVPQIVVKGEAGSTVGFPSLLPDGKHFVYFDLADRTHEGRLMVASLDPREKPRKLLESDSAAQYAPTGHLLYVKEGSLVARPFDPSALKVSGEAVPVAEQMKAAGNGFADFSVSENGILVYRGGAGDQYRLVWVDRSGKEISEIDRPGSYRVARLSRDDSRLAVAIWDTRARSTSLWIRDLARGVTSRFTFDSANDVVPVWSPDGSRIVFSSDRKGPMSLFEKASTGTGPEKEIWSCGDPLVAGDWSADGRFLLVNRRTPTNKGDIWIVPMDGTGKPFPFVEGPFADFGGAFSPDVRYVAYMSDESGRFEVYVQRFPGPGGKWQVSAAGGIEPRWSADGRTIYFRTPDGKFMAAPVETRVTFSTGVPRELFDGTKAQPVEFEVSRDGQRFLLLELGGSLASPITVVLHWPATLRK